MKRYKDAILELMRMKNRTEAIKVIKQAYQDGFRYVVRLKELLTIIISAIGMFTALGIIFTVPTILVVKFCMWLWTLL